MQGTVLLMMRIGFQKDNPVFEFGSFISDLYETDFSILLRTTQF